MAKKLKDILKLFNEQINSNEMSSLLSASNPAEVEITDEGYEEIKTQVEGLLTVESAQTNREVKKALYKLHEKTIKTDLEEKLSALAEKMEAAEGYKSAKTVEEKIEFLTGELDNIKKPPAGADADTIKKYKSDIAELNQQISTLTEQKDSEINEIKTGFEKERLKNAFRSKLSGYKLADAYQKDRIKKSIFDDAFNEVSKKAVLKLNEDGEIQVFDPETPDKPLYIKNKPAGVDDLVSPILQDYIQVSDPNPPKDPKQKVKQEEPEFQAGTFAADMARRRNEVIKGMSQ